MRSGLIIVLLASHAMIVSAQSIAVGYRQTISVRVTGALAAFSLSDFFAEAQAESGMLTLFGKNPGSARVVVVTQDGSEAIEVQVIPPAPSYPPGFVLPLSAEAALERGSYESRFISGPSQSENTVDLMRREGDRAVHFHMAGTFLFNRTDNRSNLALNSFFYQILTPRRDITFLDQLMTNSPLTVEGSIVRGFHLREGNLLFHAGYSSTTSFENFILPSQREGVVGASYRFSAGKHAVLTPNLYFFQGNDSLVGYAPRGTVASLMYAYERGTALGLLFEAGFSRGFGAAGKFHYDGDRHQLIASLRYEPRHFASLSSSSLHGFYSNVDWTHELSRRLTSTFSFTDNHFNLPSFNLTNIVADANMRVQLSRQWAMIFGFTYGRSQSHLPPGPVISVAGVPVGLNFDSHNFQGGFLYQYSKNSSTISSSDEFRITLGTHWRGLRWNGFADRQTHAMTIAFILAGAPGLQQALDQLAISATTPDQIALALNQAAGLLNQGLLSGININADPVRVQVGSNLTWSNAGSRQRFNFNWLYSRNELLQGENRTTIATLSYSLKFKRANECYSSMSWLRDNGGNNTPLYQVGIRRQLGNVPDFFIRRRRGTIAGVVFADNGATGAYQPGSLPLSDVEVILDHTRRTRTGKDGHYRFAGIAYGSHSVEVVYHSPSPFFFTTPSRVQSEVDSEVNFGIGLSLARIIGSVRSDAGIGVPGVEINVSKGEQQLRTRTDSEGMFRLEGLSSGEYEVKVDADSVPPGYSVADLQSRLVPVDPSAPTHSTFLLKVVRNISGRVVIYDRTSGREIPVANNPVLLRELGRTSTTDANGIYLFRDLPAGSYTLTVTYQEIDATTEVILPNGPAFHKDIDMTLVAK